MRNMRVKFPITFLWVLILITLVMGDIVSAVQRDKPIADVMLSSSGVNFLPKLSYDKLVLSLSRPDGTKIQRTFDSGNTPYLGLSSILGEKLSDGSYTYELKVIPFSKKRVRGDNTARGEGRSDAQKNYTQTGYFQVKNGMILTPSAASEDGLSSPMDIVHSDDVIVDGSLCVGNDCYSGLAFGFDTIVLMENNLRIFFDDTSTIQNYPRNDWRIICNDSTDGGGRYFAIEDATEVSNIMVLEAGAPDNSIYVDSHGDVGINTSTPYYELHIVDGDSPAIRLDQDGSYGWTPQKWDLCGNESNFFIRDATHASKLPFRIEPEAPTDSIFTKSNGNIGLGTGSPAYSLEVERTGENAIIVAERTSGAKTKLGATTNQGQFGTITNHPLKIVANNSTIISVNQDGTLLMSDGGSYDGSWNPASSRTLKENIKNLSTDEAMDALNGLNPVKYNYKKNKEEEHVGFIAEDVPELVAMNSRKSLSTLDIVAVLTKVVKDQQKFIKEQQKVNAQLKKELQKLKKNN